MTIASPLKIQSGKRTHHDQRDEKLHTDTPSIRPRLTIFSIIFISFRRVTDTRLAIRTLS